MDYELGTGGLPRVKDKRDFGLATYQEPTPIPTKVIRDYSAIPVLMQGKYPTCGGHAGAALDSFSQMLSLSPKYLWKFIKTLDTYPPEDGTDMRSIFKALTSGDCTLGAMPNTLGASLAEYTNPAELTPEVEYEALHYKLENYAFIDNPSWDELCQAIDKNPAVLALVKCGDGWWKDANGNGSWAEKDILPLRLGTYTSGHFITLHSYDENHIYFRNSWSEGWGRGGDGYFDRSYLPNVVEIGTAIKLAAPYIFTHNLWFGKKDIDNIQLQMRLNISPTDQNFGLKTLAAVINYQKAHGITPTGFVGPITRASLNK